MKSSHDFALGGGKTLQRRAKILEMLEANGQVQVIELTDIFSVSEVTIRNDLDKLEEKGLLIRTRGGGIKNQHVRIDYQLSKESTHHSIEKQKIGKEAARLVNEKDTILLDSGTTTLEIARNLTHLNDLTIITNALNIANELVFYPNIKIITLGGKVRQSTLSSIGPIAIENLKNLFCDKAFLGVNGIDTKYGISTTHIEDAYLNRLMMNISKEVIVVTDSSKFLKRSFSLISPIKDVHTIITDKNIPEDEFKNLIASGVKVIIAD
jgi:DeoR family transcriptional regulator, aga operon transcriptional repressor